MSIGAGRILTTHTGSLPRPDDLIQMMWAKGDGIPVDEVVAQYESFYTRALNGKMP